MVHTCSHVCAGVFRYACKCMYMETRSGHCVSFSIIFYFYLLRQCLLLNPELNSLLWIPPSPPPEYRDSGQPNLASQQLSGDAMNLNSSPHNQVASALSTESFLQPPRNFLRKWFNLCLFGTQRRAWLFILPGTLKLPVIFKNKSSYMCKRR